MNTERTKEQGAIKKEFVSLFKILLVKKKEKREREKKNLTSKTETEQELRQLATGTKSLVLRGKNKIERNKKLNYCAICSL